MRSKSSRTGPQRSHAPRRTPQQDVEWIERAVAEAMAAGTYAEGLESVRRAAARAEAAVAADRNGAALQARIRVAEAVLVAAVARSGPNSS
jgi:hypothetical protein